MLQVRRLVQVSEPDPSMYGALPPGAWWEVANGADPVFEPYADKAGDAAVQAARTGDLELVNVSFSYPLRKDMAGEHCCLALDSAQEIGAANA